MIIDEIKNVINSSLKENNFPLIDYNIDQSKFLKFGDFNTNVAMVLKKENGFKEMNPIEIANKIVEKIDNSFFFKIEVVKPGFINFTMKSNTFKTLFFEINKEKDNFPNFPRKNEIASIEYVSANPTGYLHIGHGRNAMFGEVTSRLYDKVGYDVIRDYVVNDAGNQMNILASSVLVRYLQSYNLPVELPQDSYHGEEIVYVANKLKEKYADKFINLKINDQFLIEDDDSRFEIRWFARNILLDQIKNDLSKLDIYIDEYFSEQSTHDEPKKIEHLLDKLKDSLYKKDGALWFKSTNYLDDKDRVLIKSNGLMTYFLPDIYYHDYKFTRNEKVTQAVIVLGSDHYGYTNRVKAVLTALGHKNIDEKYKFLFIQMVKLTKNGQEFKMSKRSGQSLVLSDLIELLGKEITKWNLISASNNSHLEIDIDVATKEDNNNSYYYIKYANVRANKILEKANFVFKDNLNYDSLNSEVERNLINAMQFFKQTIIYTFKNLDIQKLVNYVLTVAKLIHTYLEQLRIDKKIADQQLTLIYCAQIVLKNTLNLLNIKI